MPAREPRSPKVRIGPERGTAIRLVSTPIIETSSKLAATMGVVAIWAARETASRSEITSGCYFFKCLMSRILSMRAFRCLRSSKMPKTAATEG